MLLFISCEKYDEICKCYELTQGYTKDDNGTPIKIISLKENTRYDDCELNGNVIKNIDTKFEISETIIKCEHKSRITF